MTLLPMGLTASKKSSPVLLLGNWSFPFSEGAATRGLPFPGDSSGKGSTGSTSLGVSNILTGASVPVSTGTQLGAGGGQEQGPRKQSLWGSRRSVLHGALDTRNPRFAFFSSRLYRSILSSIRGIPGAS